MGTRNLTVIYKGGLRVAQYGQWDGYLEDSGLHIVKFLNSFNKDKFFLKLDRFSFIDEKQIFELWRQCGAIHPELVSLSTSGRFKEKHPTLYRDMGCEILDYIQDSDKDSCYFLENSLDFAAKSLFCEYCYVIDFDNNSFEIYKGFNKVPLTIEDRFFQLSDKADPPYYPVKCIKKYSLDKMISVEDFTIWAQLYE